MSSEPKIYTDVLRRRCLQPTHELMEEVGGIVECTNGLNYAFRAAGNKILAVAHCDSVTCDTDHFFTKNGVVWCTRLDDRLGVFTILDILPAMGIEVDILLTDGEESGNSTARFIEIPKTCEYNWIVQFDRRGTDVVTYQFGEMDDDIEKFFGKPGWGSYSDICELDWLGCSAMNVGVGYHEEHSLGSHAKLSEYRSQIRKFYSFWEANKDIHFEHTYSSTYTSSKKTKVRSTYYNPPGPIKTDYDAYDDHDNYYSHQVDDPNKPYGGAWNTRITTGSNWRKDVEDIQCEGGWQDWPCWQVTFKDGKVIKDVYAPDEETAVDYAREHRREVDDDLWRESWEEYTQKQDSDLWQRKDEDDKDEILNRDLGDTEILVSPEILDQWPAREDHAPVTLS